MAASVFIPVAATIESQREDELIKQYEDGRALLERNDKSYAEGIRKTQNAILYLEHLRKSNLPYTIETSLFLRLFSAFDAFTGDLLTSIYKKKPELFETISREVKVSEILKYNSFESLQEVVLRDEIESFRRSSYVDQFKSLESMFGLKLRQFEKWPSFVECAQRRNLFTHCDGQVSQQYIDVCEKEGFKFKAKIQIGEKLKLGPKYLLPSCDLIAEVALKLCHTLWRKLFPDELKSADEELINVSFYYLQFANYGPAQAFASFGLQPRRVRLRQRRVGSWPRRVGLSEKRIRLGQRRSRSWEKRVGPQPRRVRLHPRRVGSWIKRVRLCRRRVGSWRRRIGLPPVPRCHLRLRPHARFAVERNQISGDTYSA
jgi:hypothetical protein